MAAVTWNRGPWATRTTRPYQHLVDRGQRQRQSGYPYQDLSGEPGGAGAVGTGISGPDVAGDMTSDERATLGGFANPGKAMADAAARAAGYENAADAAKAMGFGDVAGLDASDIVSSGLGAAVGYGARAAATAASVPTGPMSFASLMAGLTLGWDSLSKRFGWNQGFRSIISPSPSERQGLADRYGYDQPTPFGQSPSSNVGGVDMGTTVGGDLAGVGMAPGDTRDQTGESGGTTGGNSDTSGTADSTGGSRGSDGPDVARGGVFKTNRERRTRFHWGEPETGGETAIFVPESMKRSGFQGKERAVRSGLKRAYSGLVR